MDLPSIKKLILVQPTCMAGSSSFLMASIKGRMTGLSLGGSVCMVTKAPAMSDNTLNNEISMDNIYVMYSLSGSSDT